MLQVRLSHGRWMFVLVNLGLRYDRRDDGMQNGGALFGLKDRASRYVKSGYFKRGLTERCGIYLRRGLGRMNGSSLGFLRAIGGRGFR